MSALPWLAYDKRIKIMNQSQNQLVLFNHEKHIIIIYMIFNVFIVLPSFLRYGLARFSKFPD
jgi:hypothetical protein